MKLQFNKNGLILAGFALLALATLVTSNYLKIGKSSLSQSRAETTNSTDDAQPRPEFAPGEIIFKLKSSYPVLNVKQDRKALGVDIDKSPVGFDDLDQATLVNAVKRVHQNFPVKKIDKVYKGTSDPSSELLKLKSKFSQDLQTGTRHINEKEFLKYDLSRVYKLTLDQNAPVEDIIRFLSMNGDVDYAELNYKVQAQAIIPNDTHFTKQWALHNTGQTGGSVDSDIDAPEAWEITQGSNSAVIAIIDTGIDYTHPDLGGCLGVNCKVVGGYDFVANRSNPMDDHGHGTHVAGIAAAKSNNSLGIAGVCPNCKLMAVKFLNFVGSGSIADGMVATQYAVINGAKVLNNSWGGGEYTQSFQDLINWATASGAVYIAAAGNYNTADVFYPAGYENVLTIAATGSNDVKAGYSNYGNWIDLAAPGGYGDCPNRIFSTITNGDPWNLDQLSNFCGVTESNGQVKYLPMNGTSMAAPMVSGVAGLLLSVHPDWNPGLITKHIKDTADNIDNQNPNFINQLGSGRLNAYKALATPPIVTNIPTPVTSLTPVPLPAPVCTYKLQWGTYGTGNSQFDRPEGIAIDSSGNVYVANISQFAEAERIQKFNAAGQFLAKWGTFGNGDGQFYQPQDIAIDASNNIYVADSGNHRIQVFSTSGTFIRKWGSYGSGDNQLNRPAGLDIDKAGNVWVADSENHRIMKFSANGILLTKIGSPGGNDGQFNVPADVVVDSAGNIYVSDSWNQRIQKFNSSGQFLTKWGTAGVDIGQFQYPRGLELDFDGTIYVVDAHNSRIQKFSSDGVYLGKWGAYGSGPGQFDEPRYLALDKDRNIYISDDDANHRVQKFDCGDPFIIPSQIGCVQSPAFTGDLCAGYRLITSLDSGSTCYATIEECLPNWGDGTCVKSPTYEGDICSGYRVMPGIGRACYSLDQCLALVSPTPTSIPSPTVTPTPASVNLLKNSGFELDTNVDNKPDSWTSDSRFIRYAKTTNSTNVHSGSYSGRHKATDNSSYVVSQDVTATPGATYQLSGWAKIPSTTDIFTYRLQIQWLKADGTAISTTTIKTYSVATSGWVATSGTAVAPSSTAKARIRMNVASLNATIFADDLVFKKL